MTAVSVPSSRAQRHTSREGAEARQRDGQLDRPERPRNPERGECVGEERESGAVWAQQVMPVAQREARIAVRRKRGYDGVGVEAAQCSHPPVMDVVEHVGVLERRESRKTRWIASSAAIVQRARSCSANRKANT